MSFQPVVPFGGNAGWAFLQRSREAQEAAFFRGPALRRDTEDFVARIGSVRTADDLVSDRRLLGVALGAFGLQDDINNRYFLRRVLGDGSLDPAALGNRLSDKRYLAMAEAFGFDLRPPRTVLSDFGPRIVEAYRQRQFEQAVGERAPDMRLALGLDREVAALTGRALSNDGLWFTVMATPPLRSVFERALNLPAAVGTLDVDRQLDLFKRRSLAAFGTDNLRRFDDPALREDLRRRFLIGSDLFAGPTPGQRGSVALALLQGVAPGGLARG